MLIDVPLRNNDSHDAPDSVVAMDVGGTKVHAVHGISREIAHYQTADFPNMDAVLDDYTSKLPSPPTAMVLAMAGPRNDSDGSVRLTNAGWPVFLPERAAERYGCKVYTIGDLAATAAGVAQSDPVEVQTVRSGEISEYGTRTIFTISTGVGSAAIVWNDRRAQYSVLTGESGHTGFQPKNRDEKAYLEFMEARYPHASVELAISGKYGISNLSEFVLANLPAPDLTRQIKHAESSDTPVGTVLLAQATEGSGVNKTAAQKILSLMGGIAGSALRDTVLVYKSSGGVFMTGSVAVGLGEYLINNTDFIERFVCPHAVHSDWLENVPIYLVSDPYVAVKGALAIAEAYLSSCRP